MAGRYPPEEMIVECRVRTGAAPRRPRSHQSPPRPAAQHCSWRNLRSTFTSGPSGPGRHRGPSGLHADNIGKGSLLIMSALMPARTQTNVATEADSPSDYGTLWKSWDDFFTALNQARGRAARAQSDGLTVPQYRLLSAVAELPAARSGELAERMGVSPPTTTRMLSGLEHAGIVRRDSVSGDRRAVTVALTDKGRRLLERKEAIVSEKRRTLYDSLTVAERRQAQQLLRRLAEAIEAL